jgi:hypothetical protein
MTRLAITLFSSHRSDRVRLFSAETIVPATVPSSDAQARVRDDSGCDHLVFIASKRSRPSFSVGFHGFGNKS